MKIVGVTIGIIAVFAILFISLPLITPQVSNIITTEQSQSFPNVPTTSGTTVSLTLNDPLFQGRASSVVSVTSDSPNDSSNLTVQAVSSDGKTITVGGLASSTTRNLVVKYRVEAPEEFTGFNQFMKLTPFLLGALAIGLCAIAGYQAVIRRNA